MEAAAAAVGRGQLEARAATPGTAAALATEAAAAGRHRDSGGGLPPRARTRWPVQGTVGPAQRRRSGGARVPGPRAAARPQPLSSHGS